MMMDEIYWVIWIKKNKCLKAIKRKQKEKNENRSIQWNFMGQFT